MTRDSTGHGAANVTLGIPRLREIVMTASQKPKTPSMSMKVRPNVSREDIDLFCIRASRVTLSQVVDHVVVQESLWVEGEARRTRFSVEINLYPKTEYQGEYDLDPSDILATFANTFPATLRREILAELKKLDANLRSQMAELGQGKKLASKEAEADEEEHEGVNNTRGDDEESIKDGDAGDEKRARQKRQLATYESDEEEEQEEIVECADHAVEAEYADAVEVTVTANKARKTSRTMSFETLVSQTADFFQRHLQQCVCFDFEETKCTFTLEVRGFSH